MNNTNNNTATYTGSYDDRAALGVSLVAALVEAFGKGKGKIVQQMQGSELVLIYVASPTVAIKVYTSCTVENGKPIARPEGSDAIRVCAVRRSNPNAPAVGLFSVKRVNRTGKVEAIIGRTLDRARLAWKDAAKIAA